jgi:hypothetical protein
VRVVAIRSPRRCAACHDGLDGPGLQAVCPGCEVRGHTECLLELARCPTLGCAGRSSPSARRLVVPPSPVSFDWLGHVSTCLHWGSLALWITFLCALPAQWFLRRLHGPSAEVLALRRGVRELRIALELHHQDTGRYPESHAGLLRSTRAGWRGPYLGARYGTALERLDPWGRAYWIDGQVDRAELRSSGPDRELHTADDVVVRVSRG